MPWLDGEAYINPPADQVLIDSGKLPSDIYTFQVLVSANPTGIEVAAELVADDDSTVVKRQVLPVTFALFDMELVPFEVAPGQHFRIVNVATVAGDGVVQASLVYANPRLGAKALG
jgi:hypothetical protein